MATGIYVPITVEAKEARNEIREFNKDMKAIELVYKAQAAEAKANGNELGVLTAKQEKLAAQLKTQKDIT